VKASAPGKIILFGEHAVVYGRPALAIPVAQVHADVEVSVSSQPGVWIDAADVGLHAEINSLPDDQPLARTILNLFRALKLNPYPDLQIRISSTIPVASGLGSGAAISVALLRALSSTLQHVLSDDVVNALAFETEKLHHGTPSGIDNAVITYAQPIYFIKDRPLEKLSIGQPLVMVIGDTGVPAPTKESVEAVRDLWEADKPKWDGVFDQIGSLTRAGRSSLGTGTGEALGELMDQNHALLREMTVSSPELDRLVETARRAGAFGAKLSGGGRGGNMIALVSEGKAPRVASALTSAGSPRVIITALEPSQP
jgi:mevalonate kinase